MREGATVSGVVGYATNAKTATQAGQIIAEEPVLDSLAKQLSQEVVALSRHQASMEDALYRLVDPRPTKEASGEVHPVPSSQTIESQLRTVLRELRQANSHAESMADRLRWIA